MNEMYAMGAIVNCPIKTDSDNRRLIASVKSQSPSRVIVIGSGPVGIRFTDELLNHCPDQEILLFGDEQCKPYNRVQLSALLAGEISRDDIDLPLPDTSKHANFTYIPGAITAIDRSHKTVSDATGNTYSYSKLILATGAKAHIPNIYGNERQGVFSFRSLKDTELLYARIFRSRHIVIVGGGLLGLEAAKGLLKFNTKVTVIQQGPRLMNRQLDDQAALLVEAEVKALGIDVITNSGVRSIQGFEHVEGVVTRDGLEISCDTLLFCAGITPNIELARRFRIKVNNGIVVNDSLQTSDEHIYAIGECCEHKDTTYGLVNPGYEQAAIAAAIIANSATTDSAQPNPKYQGSLSVSNLKVVGKKVCSLGEVTELASRPLQKEIRYFRSKTDLYRKLVIYRGKIIGAVSVGEWPEARRVQEAYQNKRTIRFWQRFRFQLTGSLWGNDDDIHNWPANTIVCQCNQVSCCQLKDASLAGCESLPDIQQCTKAGTVCGSCKPLIQQFLGVQSKSEKEQGARSLTTGALIALLIITAITLLPEAQVADSAMQPNWFESIWNDKFWKQTTGFSLLGMTIVGLLMSLRKRLSWTWMGNFSGWRVLHTIVGVMCCFTLILHSGFHLGDNLNQLLMVNFMAVLLVGAITSGVIGMGHKLSLTTATTSRKYVQWLHIIISWPLPALLAVHILSVYYF